MDALDHAAAIRADWLAHKDCPEAWDEFANVISHEPDSVLEALARFPEMAAVLEEAKDRLEDRHLGATRDDAGFEAMMEGWRCRRG